MKRQINPGQAVRIPQGDFTAVKLLGKGKSGYSWLLENSQTRLVLKQIHDEPCPYYSFADKLDAELKAYERLAPLLEIPRLLGFDRNEKYLVKEFVPGEPLSERISHGPLQETFFSQIFSFCEKLYPAGLNIDYFPANFICRGEHILYIDYETNPYSDEWNFENWGIYYWLNCEGMRRFLQSGDPSAINLKADGGKPIAEPFAGQAAALCDRHGRIFRRPH